MCHLKKQITLSSCGALGKNTNSTIVTTELGFTLTSAYLYVNQWHLDTVYLIESQHGDFL